MYRIGYEDRVIKQDIPALSKSIFELIGRAINTRLTTAPIQYGKPLRYTLAGHRRLRVSDYRVIYRVDEAQKTVYITAIGLRRDIYED
jgi:mRNA interferase RelE/StbE